MKTFFPFVNENFFPIFVYFEYICKESPYYLIYNGNNKQEMVYIEDFITFKELINGDYVIYKTI
jgi:hypothetical protein